MCLVTAVAQVQSPAQELLHATAWPKKKKKKGGEELPLWLSGLRIRLQQLRSPWRAQVQSPTWCSGLKDLALPHLQHSLQLLAQIQSLAQEFCCVVGANIKKKKKKKKKSREEMETLGAKGGVGGLWWDCFIWQREYPGGNRMIT